MTIVNDTAAPLVVVVGATGIQGGSVVRALAESHKAYRVRGLTRDASKPAAQELAKQGVEVHAVNLVLENAPAVKAAFKGAAIAFIVTNFWEHMSMQREIEEGKLLVDAAHEGGATRILWSGLESYSAVSGGKIAHVDHFEGKAAVTAYARAKLAGVAFVVVQPGLYMINVLSVPAMVPRPRGDGTYAIALGCAKDVRLPWLDVAADYGLFVRLGIEGEEYAAGGQIFTAGEELTWDEAAQQLSEALGKTVVYDELTPDAFKTQMVGAGAPEAIAVEFTEQFLAFSEFGYYAGNPVTSAAKLGRKPRTLKEFAAAQDWSKVLG